MLQGPCGAAAIRGLLCLAIAPAGWAASIDYHKILSGNGGVWIAGVATDASGNVYVAGSTTAFDFPVKNAAQSRNSGTATVVSRDGGMTWSPMGYLPEADVVVANPRNPSLLLSEGVYGVYRSTDAGESWTTVVDLNVERARIGYTDSPQWDPRDASVTYVPSTAGVLKSVDGGVTWRLMDNGIQAGHCCTGAGLAIDPFVAGRMAYTINERAYLSRDGGASWSMLPLPAGMRLPFVVMDPFAAGVWYAYDFQGAYRSEDAGGTWTRLPLDSQLFGWLITDPNVPGRLYARVTEGLRRSDDRGRTWSAVVFPETSPKMGTVNALAIQPGNSQLLLAAGNDDRGNGVCLLSRDGGRTWGPVGVARVFYSFRFDPSRPTVVYAAGPPTWDAFVVKLNPAGDVVYSTYLGGQGGDVATAMSVDASGNVYVAGPSESIDFPGTPARLYGGISPGLFAAKLDGTGRPVWTTLFGGGGYDTIQTVAHAADGTLAFGWLSSNGVFVSKLSADGRALLYSTKLAGSLSSIAADAAGNVYASGVFGESTFKHLLKIGQAGEVVWERQLDGTPARVAVDWTTGAVYAAGTVIPLPPLPPGSEIRCPLPVGMRERDRLAWMTNVFVAKLEGDAVRSEMFFQGNCRDTVADLSVADGAVTVAGETWSDPLPAGAPLFDPPPAVYSRPFVARFDGAGAITFASYLPFGSAARVAAAGASLYVAESTPGAAYNDPVVGRFLKISTTSGPAPPRRVVDAFARLNTPITAQEIVVVEMPGFRPAQQIDLGLQTPAPPLELGGVSVEFNGGRAGMLAVRNGEVVCVTPAGLQGQAIASVQVVSGGSRSGAFYVEVANVNPAIYAARNGNGALNTRWSPAAPGSEVEVLFTGAGAREAGSFTMPVGFLIPGSPQVEVDRVAAAPGFTPGMFAARVRMPMTPGVVSLSMYAVYPTVFAYPPLPPTVSVFIGETPPKPPPRRVAPDGKGPGAPSRPRPQAFR